VLKCKIEGYTEDIFITTAPDTNSSDGQYARVGISRGIGNRAFVVADRMGAVAFVELNGDDTPIGLLTVQKDMRVIKSRHPIDPFGTVLAPSQNAGVPDRAELSEDRHRYMNDDDDNFAQLVLANQREWNSFWFWRDKPVGEHGIARDILEEAGVHVDGLESLDQDPPDCEATLDGQFSGIEVTELVHRPTLERSIKAVRQRSRGEEPQKPEAYFHWDRDDLIEALQKLLAVKNSAKLKRSYERYVLVIHTDEFFLDSDRVEMFLKGASFNTNLITHAFLGLSYELGKGYPVFPLELVST
jgi:hypothetical protein